MNWIELLERAYRPESTLDIAVAGLVLVIAGISFALSFKLIWRTWLSALRTALTLVAVTILYGVTVMCVVPYFHRFPDGMVGILLPRFGGAAMTEHLGKNRLNDALAQELRLRLKELRTKTKLTGLDTIVAARSVSWRIDSYEEATRLKEKYNATAILWRRTTKLQEHYELSYVFEGSVAVWELQVPNMNPTIIANRIISGAECGQQYVLRFADTAPGQVTSLARNLVNNVLLDIVATVHEKDPLLAAQLVQRLPHIDSWYKHSDCAGFLLQTAAWAFEAVDSIQRALEFYALSHEHFEYLKARMDSGMADWLPEVDLRRFAAFSKWKEGFLAHQVGDTMRARGCFAMAFLTADGDTTLQWLILRDGRSFDLFRSDTLLIEVKR